MKKILALGPAGTNGHEVAKIVAEMLRPEHGELPIQFCKDNTQILLDAKQEACFGVVPIENATEGLVKAVIRDYWLEQTEAPFLHVIGEINMPIEHCLLVRPEVESVEDITMVLSHPQALEQCSGSLNALNIMIRNPAKSTAGAAEIISKDLAVHSSTAALASAFAGEIYGLKILWRNMEDFPGNATRFHIVGPTQRHPTGKDRTALLFQVADKPRSLFNALWPIGIEDVNMTSIHSIPLGSPGQYAFYCEFDCHLLSDMGRDIMKRMRTVVTSVYVLGSYPQGNEIKKGNSHAT